MLDLDHPVTKHIFAASGKMDSLRSIGGRMARLPGGDARRAVLLAEGQEVLNELRLLAAAHFDVALFLLTTLTETEEALEQIAHASDETTITENWEALAKALEKLDSHEGFGTCFI